jgi:hypothetical protein
MSILSKAIDDELAGREILTATFKLGSHSVNVSAYPLSPADFLAINKKLRAIDPVGYISFQESPVQFDGQIDMMIRKVRAVDAETGEPTDVKAFDAGDRVKLMTMGVEKVSTMFLALFSDQLTSSCAQSCWCPTRLIPSCCSGCCLRRWSTTSCGFHRQQSCQRFSKSPHGLVIVSLFSSSRFRHHCQLCDM